MVGAGGTSVAGQIISIMFNIATIGLRIVQTVFDSTSNDNGEILDNFSLLDNSVSCSKLLFVTAYHAAHTEGPLKLAFECMLGSLCLVFYNIMTHLKRNFKNWATKQIGMVAIMALGICLLHYETVIPMDHAWNSVAVPSVICSLVWLEVALLIRKQIKEDGGNEHLLRDLLMKLGEAPISIYRCVHLIQDPDSPWDANKILLLLGSGPPMLIVVCQIGWIVYKLDIVSKVVAWFMKIPRAFSKKTEQAAGATMGGNGGRDAGDHAADVRVEVGNGLPLTTGASHVGWIADTAGIKFKVIEWVRMTRRVSAAEDEQAAGVAMEIHGGGDSGQQVAEENVQVVVASSA